MRRLMFLLTVLLALGIASAAASSPPPLHVGVHGKRVSGAQWLLSGHNPFRVHSYHGTIDGRYGRRTATAARQAKYLLGFPVQALDGRFGWRLRALLVGQRKLSPLSRDRRRRRLHALAHPQTGVVALGPSCRGYYAPKPYVLVYARLVARIYGHPLVCTSGYRPGSIVYGTGRRSMHGYRAAADLGTPTESMNRAVGRAALIAAGMSRSSAAGYSSFAGWYGGVNILFQTYIGGNHHNHVHTGEWSWPTGHRGFNAARAVVGINTEQPGAWNVVYQYGLNPADGSHLGYAILAVKRELAYNGFDRGMELDTTEFGYAAKLSARAFQAAAGLTVDGVIGPNTARRLFAKRADAIGTRYGMPDHQLARQKTWESQNDPNAIGPDGQDHGLLQVRLSSHPDVSLAQAISPAYIEQWAAERQAQNFTTLHDWDGVLCAWNAGYSLAAKWVAAGKPASGGPVNGNGLDLYSTCTKYVQRVRASPW